MRFPDRVTLQGYFHPRHSLKDVCDWLLQCFNSEEDYQFDLYTSPPRKVIASSTLPVKKKEINNSAVAELKTLSDLGFTPAVLIHLSWHPSRNGVKTNKAESIGNQHQQENVLGLYLREDLLVAVRSKEDDMTALTKQTSLFAFPVSEPLVPSTKKDECGVEAQPKASTAGMDETIAGGDNLKKDKKPKWFKM